MNLDILLLEDNQELAELQIMELEQNCYQVTWCKSLKEFKESVVSKKFVMIISDINLPDGEALPVLKEFKLHNPSTPVIVQTGNVSTISMENSFYLGAISYLAKPFSLNTIMDIIYKYETLERMKSSNHRLAQIARFKFNLSNV